MKNLSTIDSVINPTCMVSSPCDQGRQILTQNLLRSYIRCFCVNILCVDFDVQISTWLVPKLEISVTVDVVREPPVRIIVDQLTCPAKVQFSFLEIFKIFSTVEYASLQTFKIFATVEYASFKILKIIATVEYALLQIY